MTREEMLRMLSTAPFEFVDPESDWKDVGFTERPIWVNNLGYGYIACDEPLHRCVIPGLDQEKWDTVLKRLSQHKLGKGDIEGTRLADLIDEMYGKWFYEDGNDLNEYLKQVLEFPTSSPVNIYCLEDFWGVQLFPTRRGYRSVAERDWCDYEWSDLTDEELAEWIIRLTNLQIL